jgi:hypothetical protein
MRFASGNSLAKSYGRRPPKLRAAQILPALVYSHRKATTGSTRVARRAGTAQASKPAPTSTRVTVKNIGKSAWPTPARSEPNTRVRPNAAANPKPNPRATCRIPCFRTMPRISVVVAPMASRTPISCLRPFTQWATTAYSPTADSSNAIVAKLANKVPKTRTGQSRNLTSSSSVRSATTGRSSSRA